ncbi:MAG TPA: hypothetical protein VN520_02480 [Streptomyces sp.]|uniref:hypothetical protein n=1 Tax=Streptomyces sp. TaxID=1931 RepID=UPI002B993873|nr:hypothetical protein [Streptomyces sp.]HWU05268.1 hypothetical protein [Streptomyces sp.]
MKLVTGILKSSLLAATLLGLGGAAFGTTGQGAQAGASARSSSCNSACPYSAPGNDLGWG